MKLKDLIEQYGEYDVEEWFEIGTDGIADEKGIKLKKPKPKSVWDLKEGDMYFVLYNNGDVGEYKLYEDCSCEYTRDQGNVFLARKEAEADLERRKVETLLLKYGGRRWFKKDEWNYYLSFSIDLKVITIFSVRVNCYQSTIYFDSEKQAREAIEQIGSERIRKALFEVR